MENASEGTHSNKNSLSIISEESAGLSASTLGLPRHSLEDVQVKRNTHTTQQSSLITEMWQNISGEKLRLLNSKMLSIFGSTWATFVNAHFLQCCVSSHASVRVLQTATYNRNFIVPLQNFTKLVSSRQHQVFY